MRRPPRRALVLGPVAVVLAGCGGGTPGEFTERVQVPACEEAQQP